MTAANELRPTTLDLLELAQTVSGYPAVVEVNPQLSVPAALRMARGPQPIHVIEYNPGKVREPDYFVAVQCGFILRFFAPPPVERMDLVDVPEGFEAVRELVRRETVPRQPELPPETVERFVAMLYHGLMRQLRSVPVELRVQDWLREAYPEYAAAQHSVVLSDLEVNLASLSAEARSFAPGRVAKASVTMNAAVAQHWASAFQMPELAKPYARAGFASRGAELLAIWRRVPEDAAHDRELIDAWAHALKIRRWYAWAPYEPPA